MSPLTPELILGTQKLDQLNSSQVSKCADSWIIPQMTILTEYSGALAPSCSPLVRTVRSPPC